MILPALILAASASAAEWTLPPAPAPSSSTVVLKYEADEADYEGAKGSRLHLKGHVKVIESTWTIKADELWLDMEEQTARSEGHFLLDNGVSAAAGIGGTFDFARKRGTLHQSSAGHGDWRIHARSSRVSEGQKLEYYGARFTGCSFDPKPHYHFRATKMSVIPKKRILAYNARFYLGPVPIFYFPVLYKSLKPSHFLRFRLQPGYDRRNGGFLKSTLETGHSPYLYSKLYLDYYSSQGFGAGAELQRRKGEDSKGSLYGYRIREAHNGQERWTVLGNQYQALTSSIAFQGRLQVQSDADFNNHYARASTLRVTPELINNGAFVYRRPLSTTRISYDRVDTGTPDRLKFVKTRESYPRIDYQTAPLRIWRLPWLNSFTAFADNNFQNGRPFIEKSVGGAWEGTRTLNIVKGVSFTPRTGYGQTYLNRVDNITSFGSSRTVNGAFVGRYFGEGTLRVTTLLGDTDLSHLHRRRQKVNTLEDDAGALDYGVETNLSSVLHALRPTRKTLLRLGTGYDFRRFRNSQPGFRERVQPFIGELTYTPRNDLSFTVRDDYQLQEGNRSFLGSAVWGDEEATYLGGGAGYNIATPDKYYANLDFGLGNSSNTWRLTGALRSESTSRGGPQNLSRFTLFEKEFGIVKLWHDFYTSARVRFRPGGVKEASIRIELKLPSFHKEEARRKDWESEWFPERAKQGAEGRP